MIATNMNIVQPTVDTRIRNNFKKLSLEDAIEHDGSLRKSLLSFNSILVKGDSYGTTKPLQTYVSEIETVLKVLMQRMQIEEKTLGKKSFSDVSIDPTDSGYPLFIRDFESLKRSKKEAPELLESFESNEGLVEDYLFQIFSGNFPAAVMRKKERKEYLESLVKMKFPKDIEFLQPIRLGLNADQSKHVYRRHISRLTVDDNIPRFYEVDFTVSRKTEKNGLEYAAFEDAFSKATEKLVAFELPHIARELEAINGLQVNSVQRTDIGPFYSRHTENEGEIREIISDNPESFAFYFKTSHLGRHQEKPKKGMEWIKAIRTGDWSTGAFTPEISEKQNVLMPYSTVQHIQDTEFSKQHKIYGLTDKGDIHD